VKLNNHDAMKNMLNIWMIAMLLSALHAQSLSAQSIDEERMKRDIEVAENVLATLIKHEMRQERTFFGFDVKGSYQLGYGITFRLPPDHTMPFVISIGAEDVRGATVISDGDGYRYSIRTNGPDEPEPPQDEQRINLKERAKAKRVLRSDSVRAAYHEQVIEASKKFILDYGELISQLSPDEKIIVTNQGDRPHFYFHPGKRTRIAVEGKRGDITALKQGKLSREQALAKLKVVHTESVEAREPDMEMLSSIFSRLYRPDLSKTYFIEGNVYYERLKDFGVIYYMQMVSSVQKSINRYTLPTLGMTDVDQQSRDDKVAELYPLFEQDMKDHILEYGRTLKSLKDNEVLVFNISLTKCTGCGIPESLELTIGSSVLKDFGAGKMDKKEAVSKFKIKKGANQ
jgi:hypothetical protein